MSIKEVLARSAPHTPLFSLPRAGAGLCGAHVLRFEHGDVLVAPEVVGIEGQEVRDAVGVHGGDKPGIMHLGTDDGIPDDELSPGVIGGKAIGEEVKIVLNHPSPPFGVGRGEAKSAAGGGCTRRDAPEFSRDLRRIAEPLAAFAECLKGAQGYRPGRVVRACEPE